MGKLCYFPLVQNPDENWIQGHGRVSEPMIRSFMPEPLITSDEGDRTKEDSLIIVCGPPKLRDAVKTITDETLGWKNVFIYD